MNRKKTLWTVRFWDLVRIPQNDEESDCWLWCGSLNGQGYGLFSIKGRAYQAHRLSYLLTSGDPESLCKMDVHHRCENKQCVNPAHLEVLSHSNHMSKYHSANFLK